MCRKYGTLQGQGHRDHRCIRRCLPDVAARAILYAAAHNRRSLWVGASTYKAIIGNRLSPAYADNVLAWTGYRSTDLRTRKPGPQRRSYWQLEA